ncbi:MAG: hypothetical protein H0W89_01220 [Candidatus Levybacteria bacterium]|nr:hypothetical protein [Candidatus Levybacteria bacterium]
MKKILFSTALFFIAPFALVFSLITILALYQHSETSSTKGVLGTNTVSYAALPTSQNTMAGDITQEDGRKERVRQFLAKYNSPLEANAGDIVDAADEFGLDYRLIPAIAMQESNLCRKIPHNSYNCWGYGIYGGKVTRFKDYKEGIYTVTKGLATRYKPRGLVTPEQIMTMYTPGSNGSWAFSVNHFMTQLQ